ncbi:unnamed protein product [Parnassius mnemosyne]|uniref:Transposase n=1 Tax=Parnassius mnemosyne TaxID=213953 RepID=A0AAV1LAJ2_9NEOP
MGFSTLRSILLETCRVIWNVLSPSVMPKPTREKWTRIAMEFDEKWNFPNCIAAIDDVGSYGRNSDGGIMQNSIFGKKITFNALGIPQKKR